MFIHGKDKATNCRYVNLVGLNSKFLEGVNHSIVFRHRLKIELAPECLEMVIVYHNWSENCAYQS